MTIRNAVIPVAGLGTRMLPATKSQPKEMLPVGRKPVVQYVVEELEANDFTRLLFITGASKNAIENHFDSDPMLIRQLRESGKEELLDELAFESARADFFYTRQKAQRGLGDAILHAAPFCDPEPFAVALGDSILGHGAPSMILQRMAEKFEVENCSAVIAFETVPQSDVSQYGIAKIDGAVPNEGEFFTVRDLIEKPTQSEAPSNLAVAARYIFAPQIFAALRETKPGKGDEIQLTDAIRLLLQDNQKVLGVRLSESDRRYDIGNFEDYFRTFVEFALADEKHGAGLRNHLEELLAREK